MYSDKELINFPKLWERLEWYLKDYQASLNRMSLSDEHGLACSEEKLYGISESMCNIITSLIKENLEEKCGNRSYLKVDHLEFLLKFNPSEKNLDRIFFQEAYNPLLGRNEFDGKEDHLFIGRNEIYEKCFLFPIASFKHLLELFTDNCDESGSKNIYSIPFRNNYPPRAEDYLLEDIILLGREAKNTSRIIRHNIEDNMDKPISFKKVKLNRLVKACYDSFNILANYHEEMNEKQQNLVAEKILKAKNIRGSKEPFVYFAFYTMLWQEHVSKTNVSEQAIEFCQFLQEHLEKNYKTKEKPGFIGFKKINSEHSIYGNLPLIKLTHPSEIDKEILPKKYGIHLLNEGVSEFEQFSVHNLPLGEGEISIKEILNYYIKIGKKRKEGRES